VTKSAAVSVASRAVAQILAAGNFFGELCEMRRMYGVAYIVQQKTGLGGKFIGERLRVIIGIRNGCGLSLRANKIERGGFAHARRADEHGAGDVGAGHCRDG